MNEKPNLIEKNIRDFLPEDTLYIQKTEADCGVSHLVNNVSFERGIVKGVIIETSWNGNAWRSAKQGGAGETVTARLAKCYLYGKKEGDGLERCWWFNKKGDAE